MASSDAFASLAAQIPKPTPTFHTTTYPRISPTQPSLSAKGKTLLITAGATGIGFETSRAFAQAGAAKIIILSRRKEPQEKAKADIEAEFPGMKVEGHSVDVNDHAAITSVLQSAGPIDILILSHAYAPPMDTPALAVPLAEYTAAFETNVLSPLHLLQTYLHALPALPDERPKTVIHVSTAATHVSIPGQLGYGTSKAAFTRALAYLADEHPIPAEGGGAMRLFSFHPGAFYTEMAAKYVASDALPWEENILLPAHFAVWLAAIDSQTGKGEADFLHGRFAWAHWDVEEMVAMLPKRIEEEPRFGKLSLVV